MLSVNEILNLIKTGKINESNLESKDLIKIEFYTEKLNEEVERNNITCYHLTNEIGYKNIIENGKPFIPREDGNKIYGVGLYSFIKDYVEIKRDKKNISYYGDKVIKFTVKPDNILFLTSYLQDKVFGKSMSLIEQCDYWDIELQPQVKTYFDSVQSRLNEFNRVGAFTGNIVESILLNFENFKIPIESLIKGIAFEDSRHGDMLVLYGKQYNIKIEGYYSGSKFYNIKHPLYQ